MPFYSWGGGGGAIVPISGAPVVGTDTVQTLTIGGTPTGGTFTLTVAGRSTVPITWSNVNATLLAAINAAITTILGASQVVATAGTLAAGIGTILLTHSGTNVAKSTNALVGVGSNAMTGTAPTLAIATTTPGVDATLRGAPRGTVAIDTATGTQYRQTSANPNAPTWT